MNRVFGKKKAKAPAPSLEDASSGIAGRIEGMDKKILGLENELRVYKDKMKKSKSPAARNQLQRRAMEVLKRKKMYEQQRDQAMGQQFNIDNTNFNLESAKATVSTVAAMKSANQELKRTVQKDLNIDDVDDLADDMAEMMDEMNEINEALGANFATPYDLDEADLDAELEMLGDELEEELETEVASSTPSYLLPTQPMFGDVCQGNLLLNYHPKDVLSTLGRLATGCSILFGYPLVAAGAREGLSGCVDGIKNRKLTSSKKQQQHQLSGPSFGETHHLPLVLSILTFATVVACTVKDVSLVVGLTGAAMGSMIVFLFPVLIYCKAIAQQYGMDSVESKRAKMVNYGLLPFGALIGGLGVFMTLKGAS